MSWGFAVQCDNCGFRLTGMRSDHDHVSDLTDEGWLINSGNRGLRPMTGNGTDAGIDLCPRCAPPKDER